ncbi:FAD:protein FMN transferase [Spirochaeta thermophila]|uniref:FAD:protein FMN transferase n=1 Tax=Winmispira thermophila (strain ATCC 49972 / DSM 6192 / RI 19.B1) TaxID=665571 RepID=E0RRD3_WINT6|nr:FAD:protein FMN transferase [Spirochaeta thermophila]ADN03110.1 hypothetical protein STHERM_c21810 [Spirochaeta thermophila DSM 6192]
MKRAIALPFAVLLLLSCRQGEPLTRTDFALGTVCSVRIFDHKDEEILDEAFSLLSSIEATFSPSIEGSDIWKVNHGGGRPTTVSPETAAVLSRALDYARTSGGAFDPAIGALVNLWGIGTDRARIPSPEEIEHALGTIDYHLVSLEGDTVVVENPETRLDLGAIVKGYASDELASLFTTRGVRSAIVDLGGNIFALGSRPDGTPWRIGIQDPEGPKGSYVGILRVRDKAVVTSGVYERFFIQDGIRYHHLLDPATGYPARTGLLSVTVIHPRGIDADALSTTLFVLGMERGHTYLRERHPEAEALFIGEDHTIWMTPGLEGTFTLTAETYSLERLP